MSITDNRTKNTISNCWKSLFKFIKHIILRQLLNINGFGTK